MASKTILTSIAKLDGQNWHTWSKETEAYLTMEDFWELIDPTEPIPMSVAAIKCDKKTYTHIWFLVEPSSWDSVIKVKSRLEAWAALKTKHEKDTHPLGWTFTNVLCSLSWSCCWCHNFHCQYTHCCTPTWINQSQTKQQRNHQQTPYWSSIPHSPLL